MSAARSRSHSVLAARFEAFERTAGSRAPLYARLAPRIAADGELLALLDTAPPLQRLPVLLFAAVHLLVLEGRAPGLAGFYPNLTPSDDNRRSPAGDDPFPAFRTVALDHAERIQSIAATSTTQTNEVGRCAWLMPLASAVAQEVGPLSLVDVGASAGLNLLMHHFAYVYSRPDSSSHRIVDPARDGSAAPAVDIDCELRPCGARQLDVPSALPAVADAVGLDAYPIDVRDETQVRWLEACVWPDMVVRFRRLVAALELARTMPPRVVPGDAVDDILDVLGPASSAGHPVVMTSWVMNYLEVERQRTFVDVLDSFASRSDLSWIIAESPAETPGLPVGTTEPPEDVTVVSLVRWRRGVRTVQRVATAHPHGFWMRADCPQR